jgi:subtilase family serine protease
MNVRALGGRIAACVRAPAGVFAVAALVLVSEPSTHAQQFGRSTAPPMITAPIADTNLVRLPGNVRPEANAANDRGIVPDALPMEHMLLQLRRSPAQEQALTQLIEELHDPASPNYHRWLTPEEFGARFGPAGSDVTNITSWLRSHGFRVDVIYPSGMAIDFSGTAGQVRVAFHTEIHNILAQGALHIANMSDPQIPAALAPVVVGVVSLNDIPPRRSVKPKTDFTFSGCGGTCLALTPADLATIYNFNPIFTAGNTGQNQTIYLIEDTDLFTNSDWTTFRSAFGLSGFTSASLNTIHPPPPSGPTNCSDPGVTGDDDEAIIDAEWASAAAPSAAIVMAACENTTTFGTLIAIQNLINGSNPPTIISLSYQVCEAQLGSAGNAAFNAIYQQGVAEGTSIFVAAGDNDAAVCDNRDAPSTLGIAVNGLASTPYNVAVGGTDFSDTASGTNSTYWNSANTTTFGSAKSYTPEIPWNNTCGSTVVAAFLDFATTYGSAGLCNSTIAQSDGLLTSVGGSGGPSTQYSKPSYQNGLVGNPADGVRDLPDVSLFAGNGIWGHFYIICFSDGANGGMGCSGNPSGWNGAGGTSFAAPIWAGIQALINNSVGAPQGNPNVRLYQLAVAEYGGGSSACNSSSGNTVGISCIFYDVIQGDNDAPCTGTNNCYLPSGTYGVLSTSTTSYAPAYMAQTGWDFVTGIGTVNVSNLVGQWGMTPQTAAHDFNGDGKSDILWRDTSGDVAIWFMNGAQMQYAGVGNVPPNVWSIVGTGDFIGDGKSDILWRDTSGNVAIWYMNGAQMQYEPVANAPTVWSIAGIGDFNGDGKADILWRDTSGDVAIWFMNGAQMQYAGVGNVPLNVWSIAGIGDFNGDGKADILWRDTSGDVAIWFMNGAQMQYAGVGNVPPNEC